MRKIIYIYIKSDNTEIDFLDFGDLCFEGKTTFEKVARRASTLSEANTCLSSLGRGSWQQSAAHN